MVALHFGNSLIGADAARFGAIQTLIALEDPVLGFYWLYSGAQSEGTITRTRLIEGQPMANPEVTHVAGTTQVYRSSDMILRETAGDVELWVAGTNVSTLISFDIIKEGRLNGQTNFEAQDPITKIENVKIGFQDFLISGRRDGSGLQSSTYTDSALQKIDAIEDTPKTALGSIGDLAQITNTNGTFLIAGSGLDEGITSLHIQSDGTLKLIDTLAPSDGLWLSGLDCLTTVAAHGRDFVVVGAIGSSSLSLVRVNDLGVLFVEDHTFDTLTSRFSKVDAITSFSISDRGFIVAGGADDGLSLLEVLPDFTFFHHGTLVNGVDGSLEAITALTTAEFGTEIQVIAAGQPGFTMARIDKTSINATLVGSATADTLTGDNADDLIWGADGNDSLSGSGGDDLIAGGAGLDRLSGGAGADVFLFSNDLERDEVLDFELGIDRLDLSDWGRIYDASSLSIQEQSDGAIISYNHLSLRLFSDDGSRIEAEMVSNDMFLF
ncbi:hypothetical protein KUW14_15725 [Pseudooceanicola nitratireducens]|uniref:calcium-binding protein n=1 Tax=Pseudooceanicola nitratireducens TaxID=517719 RepID=UPI001C93DB34|nr:hypothetical protein [Pseudooceanicola nitratireducens]MBY6167303.1 hypothetical protein [Pseudooceanicola nitratireducens]